MFPLRALRLCTPYFGTGSLTCLVDAILAQAPGNTNVLSGDGVAVVTTPFCCGSVGVPAMAEAPEASSPSAYPTIVSIEEIAGIEVRFCFPANKMFFLSLALLYCMVLLPLFCSCLALSCMALLGVRCWSCLGFVLLRCACLGFVILALIGYVGYCFTGPSKQDRKPGESS